MRYIVARLGIDIMGYSVVRYSICLEGLHHQVAENREECINYICCLFTNQLCVYMLVGQKSKALTIRGCTDHSTK